MSTQTTKWISPSTINYNVDPNGINTTWFDTDNDISNLRFPVATRKHLRRISIHDTAAVTIMADTLVLSGFTIPTFTTLLGMEITVQVRRLGRITDYVLQPVISGTTYNNLASGSGGLPNLLTYGSSTETWGITGNFTSSNFSIYFQLGPHPQYPGNDEAIVDDVVIRLTYQ
jgi:hypothetical protein